MFKGGVSMKGIVGKSLSYQEVKALPNGTHIWIESDIPDRNVFLGIKNRNDINNLDGKRKYSIEDVGLICIAKEWL